MRANEGCGEAVSVNCLPERLLVGGGCVPVMWHSLWGCILSVVCGKESVDMGALKNVAEAAGAIADVALETMLEGEESPSKPAEKHAFTVEEPEVNEFGRLTEWYHCGIRNTGSVCKNCGEYRRNRTVLDDEAATTATAATGAAQYGQPASVSRSAQAAGGAAQHTGAAGGAYSGQLTQDQKPSIGVRIRRWFAQHPNARIVLGASITLLIMLAILLFYLWDVGVL